MTRFPLELGAGGGVWKEVGGYQYEGVPRP